MKLEGIPEGYHPRHPLNTALSREPMVCDGCGRSSTVLLGFEKRGAPDLGFCSACVEEYMQERLARQGRWLHAIAILQKILVEHGAEKYARMEAFDDRPVWQLPEPENYIDFTGNDPPVMSTFEVVNVEMKRFDYFLPGEPLGRFSFLLGFDERFERLLWRREYFGFWP